MESLALVLSLVAILIQFNGVLSENDTISNEINKIHRFKRTHEQDRTLNSTNNKNQGKIKTEKSKIDITNKKREQIPTKGKPKVEKDEPKERDSKLINIKQSVKLIHPRNLQHFIEDVDGELPVPEKHIESNEYRLQEAFKAALQNKTSNDTKLIQKDQNENIPKKLLPENTTKESHELIPILKTTDLENDKKPTVNSSLDSNGPIKAQPVNTTKETAEKSYGTVCKPPNKEIYSKKPKTENSENPLTWRTPGPTDRFTTAPAFVQNSVIEIKEHKYEEEIVRYYPSKSCRANIKRHWESSQDFNPQFGNPYTPAMNNQGLTQADPYQKVTYNKDKYLAAYTCANVKDGNNGDYFYANFDVKPHQAKERRYPGYGNYGKIRKVWLDRETKIRPAKPDEYGATDVKGVIPK